MTLSTPSNMAQPTTEPVVLVVDDDHMFTTLLAIQLANHGYHALEAASAGDALTAIDTNPALRAVLCDANLPGDGLRLIQQIHSERPDLALLVISGLGVPELIDRGLPQDVPWLQKPVTSADLVQKLMNAGVNPSAEQS